MAKNTYIAITIGPIADTMNYVTKPAALWASSYMFSYISKEICLKLIPLVGEKNIVTPGVPDQGTEEYKKLYERADGIGLFHDHIIFKAIRKDEDKAVTLKDVNEIKTSVINDVSSKFGIEIKYLTDHLMISACQFTIEDGENPILACGKMLDCLELSKSFVRKESKNAFLSAFSNDNVKAIGERLNIDGSKWQLVRTTKAGEKIIRDIPSVSSAAKADGYKKNKYYCILRADGDNMSKVIASLTSDGKQTTDEKCRDFSTLCLNYCSAVSENIKNFGGITIYAGGDDLLALVPCEYEANGKRRTLFELIQEIDKTFTEHFKELSENLPEEHKPTLSFGAFICYENYPLYEAVNKSADLLFGIAKNPKFSKKNCLALRLQKHSGQSEELLFYKKAPNSDQNGAFEDISDMLSKVLSSASAKDSDNYLLSAAQKIILFETLINHADESKIVNVFKNTFDSGFHLEQNNVDFLHKTLPDFYSRRCKTGEIILFENNEKQENSYAKTLGQVLRLIKFFVEKGDE